MVNIDIPGLVRRVMALHGINQKQLAKKVGVSQGTVSKWVSGMHAPETEEYVRLKALEGDEPDHIDSRKTKVAARINGKRVTRNIAPGAIPEFETHLGAGGGGYPLPTQIVDNARTYSAEVVQDEWTFPARFLRDELRVEVPSIDIVQVRGDSMETGDYGGFRNGDRVLVDRRDIGLRQGAIFALRDGEEVIVKQVELVRGSDPPRILCTSLNPRYKPFELVLDGSAEVIGRVILKICRT